MSMTAIVQVGTWCIIDSQTISIRPPFGGLITLSFKSCDELALFADQITSFIDNDEPNTDANKSKSTTVNKTSGDDDTTSTKENDIPTINAIPDTNGDESASGVNQDLDDSHTTLGEDSKDGLVDKANDDSGDVNKDDPDAFDIAHADVVAQTIQDRNNDDDDSFEECPGVSQELW